jgi:hypothetical protein
MLTAQGAGDAALGQLTLGLVLLADHFIPAVHKFLSWEVDDVDLGPIVPVSSSYKLLLLQTCRRSDVFVVSTGMVRLGQLHSSQLRV